MENKDKSAFTGIVDAAHQHGLTKREYFAGLAMQGLLSREAPNGFNSAQYAGWAVSYADALLEELEKKKS